jgi:hypothetical protein
MSIVEAVSHILCSEPLFLFQRREETKRDVNQAAGNQAVLKVTSNPSLLRSCMAFYEPYNRIQHLQ